MKSIKLKLLIFIGMIVVVCSTYRPLLGAGLVGLAGFGRNRYKK